LALYLIKELIFLNLKSFKIKIEKTCFNNLPEKVNTYIGEDGVRISGGQKQRIGLARALYDDPNLLILDEATSALDNETEASIINEITKLKKDKIIIMIAHRLNTLKNCDKIITVKDKKIYLDIKK